jgi:beta-ureidopropionase / N-carbamoyl-L-amino-acid hydrolase
MTVTNLRVDGARLLARLEALRAIGDTGDGGSKRVALTDADKAGRDLFVSWLRDAGLEVAIDRLGNIVGILRGTSDAPAVIMGSHIDTVATGGTYDGTLGTLAALCVIEALKDAGLTPKRSVAVVAFTNEEGVRFQPDMLGSLVWSGGMTASAALAITDAQGAALGNELQRIGYAGPNPPGFLAAHAYLELHIEQGPILAASGGGIGAVTGVQAIWWSELTLTGEPNHAGTTPMAYRRNAALAAARIVVFTDQLAREIAGTVSNTGSIITEPGNINVVAGRVVMTLDMRNPDDANLAEAERRLSAFLRELEHETGVGIAQRDLARFAAQPFDAAMIGLVEDAAKALGHTVRRMHSGAGHDAQMMARIAPTAMIFVPSARGISHNPAEFTTDADCIAGANVLLAAALKLAND